MSILVWDNFEDRVFRLPPRVDLEVKKSLVEHPTEAGYRRSSGLPMGQSKDFRQARSDGRGLHIREYESVYRLHWDECEPGASLLGHLSADTPRLFLAYSFTAGAGLGALASYFISGRQILGGALVGSLVGALLGTALLIDPGGKRNASSY